MPQAAIGYLFIPESSNGEGGISTGVRTVLKLLEVLPNNRGGGLW